MIRSKKWRYKLSKNLRNNLYMIRCLSEAKEDSRRGAMRCCSGQMCNSMSEIAANLLKGNIPLTDRQFLVLKVLKRHAKDNEALSKKEGDLTERRLPEIFDASCQTCCEKPDTWDCWEHAWVTSRRPLRPSSWNDMEHYNKYYLVDASEFDNRRAKSPPTSNREQRRHDIEHSYKNLLRELVDQSA